MIKKVKPLNDKVLIKVIEETQEKTPGGIYLPETATKEKPVLGQVKEMADLKLIKIKKGDYVLYNKFSGTEIKINAQDYVILAESDILATVELD